MSVRALDLLTAEEVDTVLSINAETLATQRSTSGAKVRFGVTVPGAVRDKLSASFGFPVRNPVPAQLARGETTRHVDVGEDAFENTHLVYLTDSAGELEIEGERFPIAAGRGYVFGQGLAHGTVGATGERFSLGPFNEHEKFVGILLPPCAPITDPYEMPDSLHTEVKKSKVLIQSEPATPIQKYSQTYTYSRAEQIKARVLASKCCGNCS
jgi:hypothetical protein